MHTSRTNISSLLVATMSVCACILLFDAQAAAHQAVMVNKSQSAGFVQGKQRTPLAQSRQYATLHTWPLNDFVSRFLKFEKRMTETTRGYDLLVFYDGTSRRSPAEEIKHLQASSNGDEVTKTYAMPRETFCALLSKYLSSN